MKRSKLHIFFQLKGEAQSEPSKLLDPRNPLIVHRNVQRDISLVELECQTRGRVVRRPVYLSLCVRVEMIDEPDEVVSHVAAAERVQEVAAVELSEAMVSPIAVKKDIWTHISHAQEVTPCAHYRQCHYRGVSVFMM